MCVLSKHEAIYDREYVESLEDQVAQNETGTYILDELNPDARSKEQWIMVTHRMRGTDEQFAMGHAWSVTKLGAKEALQRAQDELARVGKCLPNIEARIEGGEF